MSSLMQFRGDIKNNKVGLLFYLQREVEDRPVSCNHCGTPWDGTCWCPKCKRFLLFVNQKPSYEGEAKVIDMREEHPGEYAKITPGNYTSASNRWSLHDAEPIKLTILLHGNYPERTSTVPKLYRAWRKPVGMWGCWVVFRWNGQEHVPDLSCPIGVTKLPRDAKPLTEDEQKGYWAR